MSEATQKPEPAPQQPREDRIATEPATVERCQADYQAAQARRR